MNEASRKAEECPHRLVSPSDAGGPLARCRLLQQILNIEDPRFSSVGRDACEACCRSFPPSADEINPVVASLLYGASSEIARAGGVAGCDRARSLELAHKALLNLPSEQDCLKGPPLPEGTEADESGALFRIVPAPNRRSGPRVKRWAVGVTTAHREVPTLSECLTSLEGAGWDRPRLFVDGPIAIPDRFANLPRTIRSPRVGAWPNYYLALAELLMREPEAQAYMIAQDDALFASFDLRAYLQRILWPGGRPGIISLFCSRAYTRPARGWHLFRGCWIWCATAFIFSRDAARNFLADREVVGHRWNRRRNGLADIDWCIGRWALIRGVPIYYPCPSLVQHIGDVSSLWKGQRVFGNRRASWFASP